MSPQPVTQHGVPGGKVSEIGGRVTGWTWQEMFLELQQGNVKPHLGDVVLRMHNDLADGQ